MIIETIEQVKELLKAGRVDNVFECDEVRMINIKIDSVPRDQNFVYLEEPTYGYFDIPYRGGQRKRTSLRLYFCKFIEMHSSGYGGESGWSDDTSEAVKRIELRNSIEQELVLPFLYQLRNSDIGRRYPEMMNTIRVLYPMPRFDANEVSVCLEFMIFEEVCLHNFKPMAGDEQEQKN